MASYICSESHRTRIIVKFTENINQDIWSRYGLLMTYLNISPLLLQIITNKCNGKLHADWKNVIWTLHYRSVHLKENISCSWELTITPNSKTFYSDIRCSNVESSSHSHSTLIAKQYFLPHKLLNLGLVLAAGRLIWRKEEKQNVLGKIQISHLWMKQSLTPYQLG